MNAARVLIAALAILLWAMPAAAQNADLPGKPPHPRGSATALRWQPIPPALRPDAPAAADDRVEWSRIRLDKYTYWGLGVGGATGLAYSLASGDSPDSLERVLTVVVGAGVGLYLGAAIDVVRSLRRPDG